MGKLLVGVYPVRGQHQPIA